MSDRFSCKNISVIVCDNELKIISKNACAENNFPKIRQKSSVLRCFCGIDAKAIKDIDVSTVISLSYEDKFYNALVLKQGNGIDEKYFFFFYSLLQTEYAEKTVAFLYKMSKDYVCRYQADTEIPSVLEKYVSAHSYIDEILIRILKRHRVYDSDEDKIYDLSEIITEFCDITSSIADESDLKILFSNIGNEACFAKLNVRDFIFLISCAIKVLIKTASDKTVHIISEKCGDMLSLILYANTENERIYENLYEKYRYEAVIFDGLCSINGMHLKSSGIYDGKISCEISIELIRKNSFTLTDSGSDEIFEAIYKELLLLLGNMSNKINNP